MDTVTGLRERQLSAAPVVELDQNAALPMIAQWDDREVVNNWYPGEILDHAEFQMKDVDVLTARGRR